jgi:hypothetical protein
MSTPPDVPGRDAPRVTPWELVFGETVFDVTRFERLREQAQTERALTMAELFMLPVAGELLHEMVPPEGGRDAVAQVRALLFAAYTFRLHGCNVYRVSEALLRELLDTAPPGATGLPGAAGYVQLPRNLVWARITEEGAPEPVDGFFWSSPDDSDAAGLDLLFALGIRPGRPGLSLFDVRIEPPAQLRQWSEIVARPDGHDFANVLPGGELQGYHALTTRAEALKLAARCMAALAAVDEWHVDHEGSQLVHTPAHG